MRPGRARGGVARLALSALLVGALLSVAPALADPPRPTAAQRFTASVLINVADLLANEPGLPLPVRQRSEGLYGYYQERQGRLLWIGTGRMAAFLAHLKDAEADGLDSSSYPSAQLTKLADAAEHSDARGQAIVELFFSAAFLEYASDLRVGRFLPHKVDPNFFIANRTIDQPAALSDLGKAKSVDGFFAAWQPQHPEYLALKGALARYRQIAATGGWPTVPLGGSIKPGTRDPRVPALRARLAVTDGAVSGAAESRHYDEDLVALVQAFQVRHGLAPDGVVGNATVAALNVTVEERIGEIVMAMERWRWMPASLGSSHLMVNIAGFDLTYTKAGRVADRMAVVVGKPYARTPVFSDAVRYVELNPYWNVPSSIAINEELPILRSNPARLAAQGFEAVRGDQAVSVTQVDWSQYGPKNFPYRIRQKPGPVNALGAVKFVFPNRFNVYLHDTPSHGLFSRASRAFSHGCIRLSRPVDLAVEVLAAVPGWHKERIDAVIAGGKNTRVNLVHPLPVHIVYFTAWVENGRVNFRNDVYGQDAKLLNALEGKNIAW